MFDTCEVFRIEQSLNNSSSIFDVSSVILDPRVEHIWQTIFPQKDEWEYSHALTKRIFLIAISPDFFKVIDRVHFPFMPFYVYQ